MENDDVYVEVGLENILHGAVNELFKLDLEKVQANIHDENTDREAKREMTIKLIFVPELDTNGRVHNVRVVAKTALKLPSHKGAVGTIYAQKKAGKYISLENRFTQPDLYPPPAHLKEAK